MSAADIADARGLQRPFVAKLLSALSQVGIVSGSPGPGGGYALAKDPAEIRLRDVWLVFERPETHQVLPFFEETSPSSSVLRGRIDDVKKSINSLLDETTFDLMITGDTDASQDLSRNRRMADPSVTPHKPASGASQTNMLNGNGSNGHRSV